MIKDKEMQTGILHPKEMTAYADKSIVSRQIIKNISGSIILFAFDKGQQLSEHSTPFDAVVQVIEGSAEIHIEGRPHLLKTGEMIIMPANIPHAVFAVERFKMLLTMIKVRPLQKAL